MDGEGGDIVIAYVDVYLGGGGMVWVCVCERKEGVEKWTQTKKKEEDNERRLKKSQQKQMKNVHTFISHTCISHMQDALTSDVPTHKQTQIKELERSRKPPKDTRAATAAEMATPSSSPSNSTSSTSSNGMATTTSATTTSTSDNRQTTDARFLCSFPCHQLLTMPLERVKELRIREGTLGIMDLRAWGAANVLNRLELLIYFIEEKGVRVNSFTEEENELLAEVYDVGKNYLVEWALPLQGALAAGGEESVDYLMARMQQEEVDT